MEEGEVQIILTLIKALHEEIKEVKASNEATEKHVTALEKEYDIVARQQAEILKTFKEIRDERERLFKVLKSGIKWLGTALTISVSFFQLLPYILKLFGV